MTRSPEPVPSRSPTESFAVVVPVPRERGMAVRYAAAVGATLLALTTLPVSLFGMSISASLASFDWNGVKVNLIDTPGEPSFIADALGALRVCESAVFVVNAVLGVADSYGRPMVSV